MQHRTTIPARRWSCPRSVKLRATEYSELQSFAPAANRFHAQPLCLVVCDEDPPVRTETHADTTAPKSSCGACDHSVLVQRRVCLEHLSMHALINILAAHRKHDRAAIHFLGQHCG